MVLSCAVPFSSMAQVLSVLLFWGDVDKKRGCLSTQLLPGANSSPRARKATSVSRSLQL